MIPIPFCPHCGKRSKLVNGIKIYPSHPHLADKPFWACLECRTWVGCHPGSTRPLGSLAGPELRAARHQVHLLFDPLWKSGKFSRSSAYAWLSSSLGLSSADCHVGKFDLETCQRAIQILQTRGT